jgi:phage-related protein (TIGR01555 family)
MLFWGSMQGLANALSDADQAVFKLDGLMDIIKSSSDGDDAIRKRLALLQHGRSVARAIAVDAEKENFEYIGRTFTGYDTGVYALMYLVSAACGIPVSLLFGRAPAGLNATGDADIRFFYDQIKSFQEVTLMPRLRRVFELLMTAKLGPMGGVVPDDWSISFRSLWQPTALERADIRLKTAQADQIEIDANVITSEEARLSHYSGDEYNEHISIDMAVDPEAEAADRYEQQQTQVAQPQQAQIDPSKSPAGDNPDSPE